MIRTSIGAQAQYRLDFILQLVMAIFWVGWNVAPVWVIFQIRPNVAGWNRDQAMVVMSCFLMLRALIEGIVSPNLNQVVWQIRGGTFDFVLLKPVDTQLMVSLSKVVPAKVIDFSAGAALAVYALNRIDPAPSPQQLFAAVLMLIGGGITIYAIWLLISCTAFWFVKVDNLAFLFSSVFDAARWPIGMFRGWVRVVLTFVIPVAVMTSYPALAVFGQLDFSLAAIAWATGLTLLIISRQVWRIALRHYSSASS